MGPLGARMGSMSVRVLEIVAKLVVEFDLICNDIPHSCLDIAILMHLLLLLRLRHLLLRLLGRIVKLGPSNLIHLTVGTTIGPTASIRLLLSTARIGGACSALVDRGTFGTAHLITASGAYLKHARLEVRRRRFAQMATTALTTLVAFIEWLLLPLLP